MHSREASLVPGECNGRSLVSFSLVLAHRSRHQRRGTRRVEQQAPYRDGAAHSQRTEPRKVHKIHARQRQNVACRDRRRRAREQRRESGQSECAVIGVDATDLTVICEGHKRNKSVVTVVAPPLDDTVSGLI